MHHAIIFLPLRFAYSLVVAASFSPMDNDDPNKQQQQHADTGEREGDDDPPPESQPPTGGGGSGTTMPRPMAAASPSAATRERQRSTSGALGAPGGRLQTEAGGDGPGQGRSRGPKRPRAAVEEGQGAGSSSGVVKPRKKPQEFDAPAVASPCSVCGRRFGSWKALFGHMRSHPDRDWRGIHPPPKFNREGTPPPEDQDATMKEQAEDLLLGVAQEVAARFGAELGVVDDDQRKKEAQQQQQQQHRCIICSQLFPSGPALGGHMRTHSLPLPDRQFQAQASSSTSRRRGLGIDLNLPNDPADPPKKGSPSSPEGGGGFDLNRRPSPDDDQQD